jgi:pimeloyl-ACP methyl ester carboxylesterase
MDKKIPKKISSEDTQIIPSIPDLDKKTSAILSECPIHEMNHTNNWEKTNIPVVGGYIQSLHRSIKDLPQTRPVVIITGWGATFEGFQEVFSILRDIPELYIIETREKNSSRLEKNASMDMSQQARDLQQTIEYLNLQNQDFILFGSCWGASIILQGLIDKSLTAPTIVVLDPMHRLWYPRWLLKYVSPYLPAFIFNLLKPIMKASALRGMNERVQRQRAVDFINNGNIAKWKKVAEAVTDFELFGNLAKVNEEVFVVNGTHDKIHDQKNYPKIAKELPRGRFIFLEANESERTHLMGCIIKEFVITDRKNGIPLKLKQFEVQL